MASSEPLVKIELFITKKIYQVIHHRKKTKVPNVCKERGGSGVHIVEQVDCGQALGQKQQQKSQMGLKIY